MMSRDKEEVLENTQRQLRQKEKECDELQRIQVERLMTSVIAFVITVDCLRCETNCQTLLGGHDIVLSEKRRVVLSICVMAIEIIKNTPAILQKELLQYILSKRAYEPGIQQYSEFVQRIVNEVPHLQRMNSMRLTVKEDEIVDEVDLSRKYFSLQMKGLLDKGAKNIRIRVYEFPSPAVDTGIHRVENMADGIRISVVYSLRS